MKRIGYWGIFILYTSSAWGKYDNEQTRIFPIVLSGLSGLISTIYTMISKPKEQTYRVRISNELGPEERDFRHIRDPITHQALEKFLDRTIAHDKKPIIAFCFSGGGMRALVLTLAFLEAAEALGLLDTVVYMAGLSGSAWALARWIASGESLNICRSSLGMLSSNGLKPIVHPKELNLLTKHATQWFLINQPLSAINIYGALLAHLLFADKGNNKFTLTLKDTHSICKSGVYPLPIYTAVAPINNHYEWFEISPFEIGSAYNNVFAPIESYGSKFKEGKSVGSAAQLSLGYFLGIFGSAFHVTLLDIIRITGNELIKSIASLPSPLNGIFDDLLYALLKGPLENVRALPSTLRNPAYKIEGNIFAKDKYLTLIDAGISFNLPFPVLLDQKRGVDVIVVYDASADNESFDTLKGVQDYAIQQNLLFPDIDYNTLLTSHKLMHVFQDKRNPKCPTVIYFPMKKNNNYSSDFDPVALSKNGFCSTYNFTYDQNQIDMLAGLASQNLVESIDIIKQVLNGIIDRKSTYTWR